MRRMILLVAVAGGNGWLMAIFLTVSAAPVPAPPAKHEHYTETIEAFTRKSGLDRYALYVHD